MSESVGFPPLEVQFASALAALLMGGLLGATAAAVPAYRTTRLEVTASLRHVG
jgi:ABC-type antimicrobial peptide transport system permease subunit